MEYKVGDKLKTQDGKLLVLKEKRGITGPDFNKTNFNKADPSVPAELEGFFGEIDITGRHGTITVEGFYLESELDKFKPWGESEND